MTKGTILVTGAAGNLGSRVVDVAVTKGFRVKAATRHPEKMSAARNVQPVRMDYADPHSVDTAIAGVNRVFLVAPPLDPAAPEKLQPVIERSKALGVEQIVFVSALGADSNEQAPLRVIERTLMDSGVNYTILRPNFFMENFSAGFAAPTIKNQGGIFLAAGEGKTSFISVRDIALVAGAAFARNLVGEAYNLTGPAALDHAEVARIIGAACGRDVKYHAIPEEAMLKGARDMGMPEGAVQYLKILYSVVRAGYAAAVTDEVKQVTGKDPMTFEAFARASKGAWK
jgi:uncharacterized protein YbjT (DUF2867 family)